MSTDRILVTGASGGIGAALIREFAAPGVEFLLLGRDEMRLREVSDAARDAGAKVVATILDVRDNAGFELALSKFAEGGPIDLALLAAGVKTGNASGIEPTGQAARVLEVNLNAVVAQVEALLVPMLAQRQGRIALFSSLAALAPQPDLLSYSASKAGLRAYGSALRRALRDTGVSVHVISLGFVETPMTDRHNGPTPMKIPADKAARKIRRGIDQGAAFISVPRLLVLLVRLQNLLPVAIADWIDTAFRAEIVPDQDEAAATKKEPAGSD